MVNFHNKGHAHPKVVKAIVEQAPKGFHLQVNVGVHKPMLDLIAKLQKVLPEKFDRFFFTNSGAEAVENAVKIAKSYSKKQNIIAFQGGFHGRTFGTLSLTTSKSVYRVGFGAFTPNSIIAPFPVEGKDISTYIKELEYVLKTQSDPIDTAAFIIEPIQGEGGYRIPPINFMKALREVCDKHNILLITDEIQTGFGRTGKFWGFEHFGIVPDIVTMAKGIASGLPLSCVATNTEYVKHQVPGSMGGTYSGNVVACAAAIATMEVMEEENLLENVNKTGGILLEGLKELKDKNKYYIKEARGKGLAVAIDFEEEAGSGVATKVTKACLSRGLLLMTTGPLESIRFMPPLNVSVDEIKTCLEIFEESLSISINDVFYKK